MKYYRKMDNSVKAEFTQKGYSNLYKINNIDEFKTVLCRQNTSSEFSYKGFTIYPEKINYLKIFEYNSTHLPDYFLSYYKSIESIVNFNLITDQLETIGYKCFYSTWLFNQEINLPNITSIGDYFLNSDFNFNSPIIFGNKLKRIGNFFLNIYNMHNRLSNTITTYDHNIILPDSIEYIELHNNSNNIFHSLREIVMNKNNYIKLPYNFYELIKNTSETYFHIPFSVNKIRI